LGKIWEDLSLEVITVDLGGGRRLWRRDRIHDIAEKTQDKFSLGEASELRFA